jgi:hypothetical protein
MSDLLTQELRRSDLLARAGALYGAGRSRFLDLLRAAQGDRGADQRVRDYDEVARALDDLTTADLPTHVPAVAAEGRRVLTPLSVAATAPVLAALAVPQSPAGLPAISAYLDISAIVTVDPVEKAPAWSGQITGDELVSEGWTTVAAGANVAQQVLDFAYPDNADADEASFVRSVDAALEAALLTRLAGTGTPAADFATAYGACLAPATHLVGAPSVVLAAATAVGGAAGLTALGLTVIATGNYSGALLLNADACVIAVTPFRFETRRRPGLLGVDVACWRYGIAGAREETACQVIAGTP